MADRYQTLSRTSVGAFVVRRLGLPDPVPLRRFTAGGPLLVDPVLVGGDGRVRGEVIAAVAAAGADVMTDAPAPTLLGALVFDATSMTSASQLVELQRFFSPHLRRLSRCGRVVLIGTTPDDTGSWPAQVAQRALEGFTRSLAKEVGRGSTVQLVYVAATADGALASTLAFLLSAKSAYVSGQVVRVTPAVAPDDDTVVSAEAPLAGKVALVTGASRGIGAAIARTLRRDGARIVG
ncbi:MAG: short chain dehydrogenase, partial [Propionibacteriales bacterium]|nr:short chain dehydrogenase [Propionibacteriales bacterium]